MANFTTTPVRVSFPNFKEPRSAFEGAKPKFGGDFLIDKTNEALINAINEACDRVRAIFQCKLTDSQRVRQSN